MGAEEEKRVLIFTYGTLKQGFSNHGLLQDMIATGDAAYQGIYRTVEKLPLVCGPYRVPFLLNFPGSGHRVWGELYAISGRAMALMDELEGTSCGHYKRLPVQVETTVVGCGDGDEEEEEEEEEAEERVVVSWAAEAYYANESYAEEMWKRNGEKGFSNYSEKEAKGYVKRKDRPQHLSFLDHIRIFISSFSSSSSSSDMID